MASTITKKIKANISGLKLGYMNAAVTGLVTDLKEIRSYMKNDVRAKNVDVLGAIDTLQPPEEVMTKAGKRINVAKVTLVDQSCRSVSCTFWGSSSDQAVNWSVGDILSIRRAKVQEYAGAVVLGCTCSEVRLNSDDTEVTTLTDWYTNAKQSDTEFQPLGAPCPSGAVGGSSDQRGSNRRVVMQLPVRTNPSGM
uniref:REPA_OB_2 domain-containing protein n=1 Tax=Macrostomum lignano TaxID=282301 RepID=A0A1I8I369_9PLAT